MKIGYARVSTKDQNLERQLDELTTAGCEKIFQEKISGTKRNRPEFDKMIDQLRQGDLVIVSELTRISRSTKDLVEIVELFKSKGVELKSIKEAWIDTTTAQGKLIFTFFAGIAEYERNLTVERVNSGLKAARKRGIKGGRPKTDKKVLDRAVKMWQSKTHSISDITDVNEISVGTLYTELHNRGLK